MFIQYFNSKKKVFNKFKKIYLKKCQITYLLKNFIIKKHHCMNNFAQYNINIRILISICKFRDLIYQKKPNFLTNI